MFEVDKKFRYYISILITARNLDISKVIATFDSLGRQGISAKNFEIIVAGITENSDLGRFILSNYSDYQILFIGPSEPNGVRNDLVENASGENIIFMESGDTFSDDSLKNMTNCIHLAHIPTVPVFDSDKPIISFDEFDKEWLYAKFPTGCLPVDAYPVLSEYLFGKIIPVAFFENNSFDENLTVTQDLVFLLNKYQLFKFRYFEYDVNAIFSGAYYVRDKDNKDFKLPNKSLIREHSNVISRLFDRIVSVDNSDLFFEYTVLLQKSYIAEILSSSPSLNSEVPDSVLDISERFKLVPERNALKWPGFEIMHSNNLIVEGYTEILVVGSSGKLFNSRANVFSTIKRRYPIKLAYFEGRLLPRLDKIPSRRIVLFDSVKPKSRSTKDLNILRQVSSKFGKFDRYAKKISREVAPHLISAGKLSRVLIKFDKGWAKDVFDHRIIVALDEDGKKIVGPGVEVLDADALYGIALVGAATTGIIYKTCAAAIAEASARLAELGPDFRWMPPLHIWMIVTWRMIRSARVDQAEEFLKIAFKLFGEHPWLQALQAYIYTKRTQRLLADAPKFAKGLIKDADTAFSEGDSIKAGVLLYLAVELLLDTDALTEEGIPQLIADPNMCLTPLSESKTWQEITKQTAKVEVAPVPKKPKVLILEGAFSKFSAPISEALKSVSDVRAIDLGEIERAYSYIGPDIREFDSALRFSLGSDEPENKLIGFADILDSADIVFANWVDKGALLASRLIKPGKKFFVRFAGVDTISPWQFMIDWGKVTDVTFCSDLVRSTVVPLLGNQIAHCKHHLLGTAVEFDRFTLDKTPDANRRLGMVGWAQWVKDPMWTIELLAILRENDPSWKLSLIGKDYPANPTRFTERIYSRRFRHRTSLPDVFSAIEYVGYTNKLPKHFQKIGFAISSSLRESFHVGAMEMVASGAIPVIRDWPTYKQFNGAATLFGPDSVVETVEEAAERILAYSEKDVWEENRKKIREELSEKHDIQRLYQQYREIIIGS